MSGGFSFPVRPRRDWPRIGLALVVVACHVAAAAIATAAYLGAL